MAYGPVDYYCRLCGKPFADRRERNDHEDEETKPNIHPVMEDVLESFVYGNHREADTVGGKEDA
jgi:hypothetical protein